MENLAMKINFGDLLQTTADHHITGGVGAPPRAQERDGRHTQAMHRGVKGHSGDLEQTPLLGLN